MRMNEIRRVARKQERSLRKATNLSLPTDLIAEAKRLDINISQACEQGLHQAVSRVKSERWLEENKEALESSNAWVEKHGLPLARFRQF